MFKLWDRIKSVVRRAMLSDTQLEILVAHDIREAHRIEGGLSSEAHVRGNIPASFGQLWTKEEEKGGSQ